MNSDFMIFGGSKAIKALSVDAFFQYLKDQAAEGDESNVNNSFRNVAWAYRCVYLKCDALIDIPHGIYPRGTDVQENPDIEPIEWDFPLADFLWNIEAGLQIWGASFWLKSKGTKLGTLEYMNPGTVAIEVDPKIGIKGFRQQVGGEKKPYKVDEVLYLRLFNPSDDLGKGTSPMQVAGGGCFAADQMNVYAGSFFKNGAVPLVLLQSEQQKPSDEDEKKLLSSWNRLVRGARKAFRTAALWKGLKAEVISPPVKDLGMPALYEQVRQQIAVAFGVPQTLLEDAANYATADIHDQQLLKKTVIPEAKRITEQLNRKYFWPRKSELIFRFWEVEEVQKDETEKGANVNQLVEAIMLAAGNNFSQTSVITKQEARDRLSYLFSTVGMEPLEEELPEELEEPEIEQENEEQRDNEMFAEIRSMREDLRKWRKKAISRFDEGNELDAAKFESEHLSDEMIAEIEIRIHACKNAEEIKQLFRELDDEFSAKEAKLIPRGINEKPVKLSEAEEITDEDIKRATERFDEWLPEYRGVLHAIKAE